MKGKEQFGFPVPAGLLTSAINVGFRLGQFKVLQVSLAEQKMLESELAGLLAELSLPSSEPTKDGRRVGVSIGYSECSALRSLSLLTVRAFWK